MNEAKAYKAAREYLRADFVENKGLTINGTFYPDLETLRRKDPIAYRDALDGIVWEPMHYALVAHPERLQRK